MNADKKKFHVVERTGPHTTRILCGAGTLGELMDAIETGVVDECKRKQAEAERAVYDANLDGDITFDLKPQLTNDELKNLAAKYPPPQSWYDEDFSGLFGENAPPTQDPDDDDDGPDDSDIDATPTVVVDPEGK